MKRYVPRIALGSAAALDLEWYYTVGESALGARAQNVDSSGGGTRAEDVGWKSDHVVQAATKYRRVERGLARVPREHVKIAALYYAPPKRGIGGREVEQFFGALAPLALLQHDELMLARLVRNVPGRAKNVRARAEEALRVAIVWYELVRETPSGAEPTLAFG